MIDLIGLSWLHWKLQKSHENDKSLYTILSHAQLSCCWSCHDRYHFFLPSLIMVAQTHTCRVCEITDATYTDAVGWQDACCSSDYWQGSSVGRSLGNS